MYFERTQADAEIMRDPLVRLAWGESEGHFPLPRRQLRDLMHGLGIGWWGVASQGRLHSVEGHRILKKLLDIICHLGIHPLHRERDIAMPAHQDDRQR